MCGLKICITLLEKDKCYGFFFLDKIIWNL